jgi:hypothetical protein
VKVRVTFTLDDDVRRAIRDREDDTGKPASYDDCRAFIINEMVATLEGLADDYLQRWQLMEGP